MRHRESEATINRLLTEQVRANTLSAGHYAGLRRLPGKKKPSNWGKAVLGVGLFVLAVVIFQVV